MGIGDWGLGIGPNPQSPFKCIKAFYNCCLFNLNLIYKVIKNMLSYKNAQ